MSLDTKTIENIDSLYNKLRAIMPMCLIGIFIPIVLLIGAVLGVVYLFQRRNLLEQLSSSPEEMQIPQSVEEKILYIRKEKHTFFAPLIILGVYAAIIALIVYYTATLS